MKTWRLILSLIVLTAGAMPVQAGVFDSWNYRMKAVFSGYNKSETLTNFPVLLVLSNNVGGLGFAYSNCMSSSGGDLRFASSTEATELNYEIERWDTNGASYVWVQVPTIANSNASIYAYWGCNTNAPAYTTNGATWSNGYVAVLHMNDPANLAYDSSPQRATGTVSGVTSGTGVVARCGNFDGNAYLNLPNRGVYNSNDMVTASIWVRCVPAGWFTVYQMFMTKGVNTFWDLRRYATTDEISFCLNDSNSRGVATNIQDGAWHLVTGVYRQSPLDARLYLDGKLYATVSAPVTLTTNTAPLQISGRSDGYRHKGLLDEAQVSHAYRSADWVYASWLNQASNAAFVAYKAAVTSLTVQADAVSSLTTNSATANGTVIHAGNAENPQVYVCWDYADRGTNATTDWLHAVPLGTNWGKNQSFSTNLTGLISGNSYTYRCYATNSTGWAWSESAITFGSCLGSRPIPVTNGLALWLDASQLTGLTNGQQVEVWTDMSGRTNHATRQGTSAGFPQYRTNQVNGTPATRFNLDGGGLGDYFRFTRISTIRTVFWVLREDPGVTATHFLLGDEKSFNFHRSGVSFNGPLWNAGTASSNVVNGTTRMDGVVVNGTNTSLPSNRYLVVSLVTAGNAEANLVTQDRVLAQGGAINGWGSWKGEIAEIAIYDRPLSNDEERAVGRYLSDKYAFSNPYQLPVITVRPVTNFTGLNVDLAADLTYVGGQATAVSVYWGTADGGTNRGAWAYTNDFGIQPLGPLTTNVTLPASNTLYCFRYCATNPWGVTWSALGVFMAAEVNVQATDATASENGDPGVFTISRPATVTNLPLTVAYAMSGTASNGVDYAILPGSVVIPAGTASVDVVVSPIFNVASEPTEDVVLTLSGGSYYMGASNTASVSIADAWAFGTIRTNVWTGTGNWTNAAGWSLGVPQYGDCAIISNTIALMSSTPVLAGLTVISNMTVSGWDTMIRAREVMITKGQLIQQTNGAAGVADQRIYLAVSNLTVAADGAIYAEGKGYPGGPASDASPSAASGPGRGKFFGSGSGGGGGGYGGLGGGAGSGYGGTYGSSNAPVDPGSGGGGANYIGGAGGGAVRIDAAGAVTVNGLVAAGGISNLSSTYQGGGAGGSIYVTCATLAGGTGGALRANGGIGGSGYQTYGGGGGRIALWVNGSDAFAGGVTVNPGTGWGGGATGTVVRRPPDGLVGLLIVASPIPHGVSSPYAYGTSYNLLPGTWATNFVDSPTDLTNGNLRYVGLGWTLTTNGVLAQSGVSTQAVFQVLTDSIFTWFWTNQFLLTATAGANGSLQPDPSGWHTNLAAVSVTASPDGGYEFDQWTGSGVPGGALFDNPLSLTMDQPRVVQANFKAASAPTARTWSGTGTWFTAANWVPAGVPGSSDSLTIGSGLCLFTNAGVMASLVVNNGATLMFTNWNSTLRAGDVNVFSNGTITLPSAFTNNQMSNNVYIICSNLTIDAGGRINADGRGYSNGTVFDRAGQGPGGALAHTGGGSYGGRGGGHGSYCPTPANAYGSLTTPVDPGSSGGGEGGGVGGAGGGAIRLQVSNQLLVNGTITANGTNGLGTLCGGGSGGGIWIACGRLVGASGSITANGGNSTSAGGGGGGRVAIGIDPALQAAAAKPSLVIGAGRGTSGNSPLAELGTVWLNDASVLPLFVPSTMNGRYSGFSTLSQDRLTLSNAWVNFEQAGCRVSITNDLQVINAGRLDFTNAQVNVGGSLSLSTTGKLYSFAGTVTGSVLRVTNNIVLDSGAALTLCAGSNGVTGADYGGLLWAGGDLRIGSNAWLYPVSQPTNGGTPLLQMQNLVITAVNGGISADGLGYTGAGGDYGGFGPGAYQSGLSAGHTAGAGYGGKGGGTPTWAPNGGGSVYGSATNPVDPGSGGGGEGGGRGGNGGGAVRIAAINRVEVNGTITANGATGLNVSGGGSGGGIVIQCNVFAGTGGVVRSDGGNGGPYPGGAGGGGRVAVIVNGAAQALEPKPAVIFSANRGSGNTPIAEIGTVYLSDSRVFPDTIASNMNGQIFGLDRLEKGQLSLTNSWLAFGGSNFVLRVTNDFSMANGARLELFNATVTVGGALTLSNASLYARSWSASNAACSVSVGGDATFWNGALLELSNLPSVTVAGNLALTNSASLKVYSGGGGVGATGTLVSVTGDFAVGTNCWVYPYSHADGASALFTMRNLMIATNGGVNADSKGYPGCPLLTTMPPASCGLGRGRWFGSGHGGGGGGYGGAGGGAGSGYGGTYGSSNAPVDPGSGGGGGDLIGGPGGGVVRINAEHGIYVNGLITANGGSNFVSGWQGGGSGGSIYLMTLHFAGSGQILANGGRGGANNDTGGGGGGRIAIYRLPDWDTFTGTVASTGGVGTAAAGNGSSNPVLWGVGWGATGSVFIIK